MHVHVKWTEWSEKEYIFFFYQQLNPFLILKIPDSLCSTVDGLTLLFDLLRLIWNSLMSNRTIIRKF